MNYYPYDCAETRSFQTKLLFVGMGAGQCSSANQCIEEVNGFEQTSSKL